MTQYVPVFSLHSFLFSSILCHSITHQCMIYWRDVYGELNYPCTSCFPNTNRNGKKPQVDPYPKIQTFKAVNQQELLCLKQPLFVCYFSMRLSPAVHYYLCTSNTPCFWGQTEFAQTVCHPHQQPRRNLVGGCRGFGLPWLGSPKIHWNRDHLKPK